MVQHRRAIYSFGDYNPYHPTEEDAPLVRENLERLKGGVLSLRSFLRQTPLFARWRDEHIRTARVLLVTNESGLSGAEKLYWDIPSARSVGAAADCFHQSMLSWLSLSNHHRLKGVNGEGPWREDGEWQGE